MIPYALNSIMNSLDSVKIVAVLRDVFGTSSLPLAWPFFWDRGVSFSAPLFGAEFFMGQAVMVVHN